MPLHIKIQSESFTQEGNAWKSEGITESEAPCRFFYRKDGSFTLSYDEKTADFSASSRLCYDRESHTLTLSRFGDTRYTAVFSKEPCRFVYAVSAFSFDACAETESLSLAMKETGGYISLSYFLTLGDCKRRITLTATVS